MVWACSETTYSHVVFLRTHECCVLDCGHLLFVATSGDITSQSPKQEGTQNLGPEEQRTQGGHSEVPVWVPGCQCAGVGVMGTGVCCMCVTHMLGV